MGKDWELAHRFIGLIGADWTRKLPDVTRLYPERIRRWLGIPQGWDVEFRVSSLNPYEIHDDVVTVDILGIYNSYEEAYVCQIWVPYALSQGGDYDLSRLERMGSGAISDSGTIWYIEPTDLAWVNPLKRWFRAKFINHKMGFDTIGTPSLELSREVLPLGEILPDNVLNNTNAPWMKDTGRIPTTRHSVKRGA